MIGNKRTIPVEAFNMGSPAKGRYTKSFGRADLLTALEYQQNSAVIVDSFDRFEGVHLLSDASLVHES